MGLAERIVAAGVPVFRCSASIPTLHPELSVLNVTWVEGQDVQSAERETTLLATPFYLDSPPARIHAGEDEVRCPLAGPEADLRFGVCRDVQALGGTDYLALAVPFRDGRRTFVTWATRRPGGFRDEDLAVLRAVVPVLSLRMELASADLSLRSLLEVYLGHNAARRVLAGAFRRGGGETIRAALWTCDLRGFTTMADARPASEVVATLDRYFETVCAPIAAGGGEVLKFVGDAVLAIFPCDGDDSCACRRALEAAKSAIDGVRRYNAERPADPPIQVGIGLHVGDVTYGNIGAQRRLDFTVIGAAVNEVCRIEPLCKDLGRALLVSGDVASCMPDAGLLPLGTRALRGVAEPRMLYGAPGY
jgi:adenylate cyclase